MSNAARQNEEIEALQSMYSGEGEFELLSELPKEGDTKSTASFRVKAAGLDGCTVLVALPAGYPTEDSPTFVVEGFKASRAAGLGSSLAAIARERSGEECVFEVLQSLDGLLAEEAEANAADAGAGGAAPIVEAPSAEVKSKWGWASASGSDTVLQVSVRSGAKVKATQITNLSELRRMPEAGALQVDLQPSRNTENYELAKLLATCTKVQEGQVEFLVGGKKEKATGERQAKILGVAPDDVVARILASE